MRRILWVALLPMFLVGCETDRPTTSRETSARESSSVQQESNNRDGIEERSTERVVLDDLGVTREELDEHLARFPGESNWSYGERTPGELAGTWVLADGGGKPIVFGVDGAFSEQFGDEMASGLYAISESGRIAAVSRSRDSKLGSHFWFDGTTITGPSGPSPRVEWKRQTVKRGEVDSKEDDVE